MISMKSKFKILFPSIAVEFMLMVFFGYLSTLANPGIIKSLEEDIAIAIELVICFQIAIILFSFDYKKKQGVLQQVTFTMETILMVFFEDAYNKAVALDVLSKKNENKEKEDGI
jgi:hypothetical protein